MAGRIFGVKIPSFNLNLEVKFEGFLPQDIEDIEVSDISDSNIEMSSVSSEESDHDEDLGRKWIFLILVNIFQLGLRIWKKLMLINF